MPFVFTRGEETIEVTGRCVVSVDESATYIAAACSGLGIVQVPVFMAREAIAEGKLRLILREWSRESL